MRTKLWAAASLAALAAAPAAADTLREALAKAYQTNPTLTGQRASVRALDENVPIARAAGLPAITTGGGYTENVLGTSGGGNTFTSPDRQAAGQVDLSVPLFTGGAVSNSVRAAETRVEAGRAGLRGIESDTFVAVVGAYMDVIRDEAIVSLNRQNVKVLDVNVQASNDRFQVGDLTRTDVAQSQARSALARAQLQQAEARLISSRENYIRLVGDAPVDLEQPPVLPNLPASPDAAVEVAMTSNPSLLAAQKSLDATRYDIDVAKASRLPTVNAVVGGNYYNYLGSLGSGTGVRVGQDGTSGTVGLAVRLPLFQGGRPAAQVRQAQARRSQAFETLTATERTIVANARAAYAVWRSSEEVIKSSETAVGANRLSLEGVRAENGVGNRTILDILNAEQELLNAQVTLVTARRDSYVAGFALLATMGQAEADDLGLDGGALYDPLVNYNRVRRKIGDFGQDPAPAPVSTSTRGTRAQDATVTRPLDPILDTPVDRDLANPSGRKP